MSEFGFQTKTIDELEVYDTYELGALKLQDAVALYSSQENKTYQVNISQLQEAIDTKMDYDIASENHSGLMSKDDKILLNTLNTEVEELKGIKIIHNLNDGQTIGSLKTIGTAEEDQGEYSLGSYAFAEGKDTKASGNNSHAEGLETSASGVNSHTEGSHTQATGENAHTQGNLSVASGINSHAEGLETTASGTNAHAEGQQTLASHTSSHAQGYQTKAINGYAHAEGNNSTASGFDSHAQGIFTQANGANSHAEGDSTIANGINSHAEGDDTQALGNHSHSGGKGTIAQTASQTVVGEYNILDSTGSTEARGSSAFIVGNGTDNEHRSNAMSVSWDGNITISGTPTAGKHLVRKEDLNTAFNQVNFKTIVEEDGQQIQVERTLFSEGSLLDLLYPIGSLYISTNAANPKTIFGGTWRKIEGKFLIGAGTNTGEDNKQKTYTLGSSGGYYNSVNIYHSHDFSNRTSTDGAHTHSIKGYGAVLKKGDYGWRFGSDGKQTGTGLVNSAGAHSHSISGGVIASGVDGTNRNIPPYLAVNIWERIQ